MELYEMSLKEQKVELSPKEKRRLISVLSEFGIKYNIHRIFPNAEEEGHLLKDCPLSVRAKNIIRTRLLEDDFSVEDTTIEQFISHYSRLDFQKCRHCGLHTVIEVSDYIHSLGLKWKDEQP